jgi:hypothetical protein
MSILIAATTVILSVLLTLTLLVSLSIWLRAQAYSRLRQDEYAIAGSNNRRAQVMQRRKVPVALRRKQKFQLAHH